MVGFFIFNDVDSRDYNVILSEINTYGTPQKRYNTYEVPGRNGDVVIDTGTFLNKDIKYGCICKSESDAKAFLTQIMKASGYCKIEDSFDTKHFRMGVMKYSIEPTVYKNDHYIFSIVFNCKPQRFFASGEKEWPIKGASILNTSSRPCMPIFRLVGNGEFEIGGNKISIAGLASGEETLINCETLESTNPTNTEYESYDPIELQPGTNAFTSTFSEGHVTLRNWEIY